METGSSIEAARPCVHSSPRRRVTSLHPGATLFWTVTITGPDLGTADAYATAAFAMGRDALHWVARLRDGYEGMLILADGRVLSTPAFPSASTSASTAAA